MNSSEGPLFVFAVVREGDTVTNRITHLVCKDFDEDEFYGLKVVSVEDICHIDNHTDPVMLVLCYFDVGMDIPYEHVVATDELVFKAQFGLDNAALVESKGKSPQEQEQVTQAFAYLDEGKLANIKYIPTLPYSVVKSMIEENDFDEPLEEEGLFDDGDEV